MPQRNLIILLLVSVFSYACYLRGGQEPFARYVASGLAEIEEGSLESIPGRELFDGAMQGMVSVLHRHGDEHSQYFPEEEADPLRSEIRQQFGGIGVQVRLTGDPPRLTVSSPPEPGTPAARAGLASGDQIQAIDGQPTNDMDMVQVLHRMRGEPGTVIQLTIQSEHHKSARTVELVREIIHIKSILGDVRSSDGTWQFRLAADPRVAHVRITLFGDRTAEELTEVLDQLLSDGVQAIVLDLRDNAGGVLDAAVTVCDLFLPEKLEIVETRGKNAVLRKRYETTGTGKFLELPIAVIVNQESASAAEIVAACLQDHGRAVVVGERSYGKGTVQQVIPLAGKSLLKLTWASFWRPSGINIHRMAGTQDDGQWGVVPDAGFERKLTPEQYAAYRKYRSQRDLIPDPTQAGSVPQQNSGEEGFVDEQLTLALEYLRGKLDESSQLSGASDIRSSLAK
jgi:carboxyl-terminal processing protease